MWKKVLIVIVLGWLSYEAYGVYQYYKAGYFTAPDLEEGDFLVSYPSGFRGVVKGVENEKDKRTYVGFPATNVPDWYNDTWSICRPPSATEAEFFEAETDMGPGSRLDAICEIDADGDIFVRGWLASVPDL